MSESPVQRGSDSRGSGRGGRGERGGWSSRSGHAVRGAPRRRKGEVNGERVGQNPNSDQTANPSYSGQHTHQSSQQPHPTVPQPPNLRNTPELLRKLAIRQSPVPRPYYPNQSLPLESEPAPHSTLANKKRRGKGNREKEHFRKAQSQQEKVIHPGITTSQKELGINIPNTDMAHSSLDADFDLECTAKGKMRAVEEPDYDLYPQQYIPVAELSGKPFVRRPVDKNHFEGLQAVILPEAQYKRFPYPKKQLTGNEIRAKARCFHCNQKIKPVSFRPDDTTIRCTSHPGRRNFGVWSCCGSTKMDGCLRLQHHSARKYPFQDLVERYQFYTAPFNPQARRAVAIDAEMGTAKDGETELIRISMIDYDTLEVLLDKLVWPDAPMLHYNTKFSGVTRSEIERANRNGQCLRGVNAARAAIFEQVGPDTIVIGHSVHNDLMSLRWIHRNIVDSFCLEERWHNASDLAKAMEKARLQEEASQDAAHAENGYQSGVFEHDPTVPDPTAEGASQEAPQQPKSRKGSGKLSLKTATLARLGQTIQAGKGHDSLEDALASRDLVEWHIFNTDPRHPW